MSYEWFLWAYLSLIPGYVIACIVLIFLDVHFLPAMYISILEPVMSYTARKMGKRCTSSPDLTKNISIDDYDDHIIQRGVTLTEDSIDMRDEFEESIDKKFKLHQIYFLVKSGIEAIIEDDVTKRFSTAELRVWNLLGRNRNYVFHNTSCKKSLNALWFIGFLIRYVLLFPSRLAVCFFGVGVTWLNGYLKSILPPGRMSSWLMGSGYRKAMRLNLCPYASVLRFHNTENRPAANTICVANHTTPVDFAVLASDNTYAVVGQKQGGFFGLVEHILSSAVPTIWFDRSEVLDRNAVARRLRDHVAQPNAPPILVFPEGTCINNTSVMKFKKGCFEVGAVIHPVAIKYDPRYADCFWNSSQDSLFEYLLKMMTSWALVVDIWYLPPEKRFEGEDGVAFSSRVKRKIAEIGGLVPLEWDGELKRNQPKPNLKTIQQKLVSEIIGGDHSIE